MTLLVYSSTNYKLLTVDFRQIWTSSDSILSPINDGCLRGWMRGYARGWIRVRVYLPGLNLFNLLLIVRAVGLIYIHKRLAKFD